MVVSIVTQRPAKRRVIRSHQPSPHTSSAVRLLPRALGNVGLRRNHLATTGGAVSPAVKRTHDATAAQGAVSEVSAQVPASSVRDDGLTAGHSIADQVSAEKVYPNRLATNLTRPRHHILADGPSGKGIRRGRRGHKNARATVSATAYTANVTAWTAFRREEMPNAAATSSRRARRAVARASWSPITT